MKGWTEMITTLAPAGHYILVRTDEPIIVDDWRPLGDDETLRPGDVYPVNDRLVLHASVPIVTSETAGFRKKVVESQYYRKVNWVDKAARLRLRDSTERAEVGDIYHAHLHALRSGERFFLTETDKKYRKLTPQDEGGDEPVGGRFIACVHPRASAISESPACALPPSPADIACRPGESTTSSRLDWAKDQTRTLTVMHQSLDGDDVCADVKTMRRSRIDEIIDECAREKK
jgi:hypothetical protein